MIPHPYVCMFNVFKCIILKYQWQFIEIREYFGPTHRICMRITSTRSFSLGGGGGGGGGEGGAEGRVVQTHALQLLNK